MVSQFLRVLSALSVDLGLIPRNHTVAHKHLYPLLRDPAPFLLKQTHGTHVVHRRTCRQNHTKHNFLKWGVTM